ncbi:MAG TPA: Hachiman antiphage defense system protein HamA [Solirubrobacterales bacterium]|nr:Hachiman antiphage defense system protein HamA [Solirubrobacterales bacterium]
MALTFDGHRVVRSVFRSELLRESNVSTLEAYMADRLPYFYKSPAEIAALFEEGFFLDAVGRVLLKLPLKESFRESHFGEIIAGVYGEEALGLKLLYSKLRLLTAENANANKMDLLFFRPGTDPTEFVFAEVKSSMKTEADGLPAGHEDSCFSNLFASLNRYRQRDLEFDLALIQERMEVVDAREAEVIRRSLRPHAQRKIEYAGFCVIDRSTSDDDEAKVLATRKNEKAFDVDLLCVAELPEVVAATFEKLSLGAQ